MVFTLVSAGQEWLNEKWDKVKKEKEEKMLAKQKADEEAEMVFFIIYNIVLTVCLMISIFQVNL